MTTFTKSADAIPISRNRPGTLPMRWREPDGTTPINIAGFQLSAELRQNGEVTVLAIAVEDPVAGEFTVSWTAEQVISLPSGEIATLAIKITDAAGEVHDAHYPVLGNVP